MSEKFHIADLEQLYKQYQPALVRFAGQYVRSPEDVREIVQDVFIAVWRNRDNLDKSGNLKSYLYTATRNKCLNFLQKRKLPTVQMDTPAGIALVNPAYQQVENTIELEMEAAELQAVILDEIRKLPDKCREVFLLSRREGFSYRQIAEKLNISPKTVENQIGIALKKLRVRLLSHDRYDSSGFSMSWAPLAWFLTNFADVLGA